MFIHLFFSTMPQIASAVITPEINRDITNDNQAFFLIFVVSEYLYEKNIVNENINAETILAYACQPF